jgi:hypothetical protein
VKGVVNCADEAGCGGASGEQHRRQRIGLGVCEFRDVRLGKSRPSASIGCQCNSPASSMRPSPA